MIPAFRLSNLPKMFRKSLALLVALALSAAGQTTALRALPVDPSEITPGTELDAAPLPSPSIREITPLDAQKVTIAETKRHPNSDAPKGIENLPEGDDAVRLQIFLDQSNFGPGVIDGKPGRFTVLAVDSWNEVKGHLAGDLQPAMAAARRAIRHPFASAVIPAVSTKWVDSTLSHDRSQQAQAKRMSYRSYAEFMAERFHTDVDFILELNGSKNTWAARPGGRLIVPNVKPFLIENVTGTRHQAEPPMSERHAVVDTRNNQVRIFEAAPAALMIDEGESTENTIATEPTNPPVSSKPRANRALVASFPITPGKPQFIHYGVWKLNNSIELPFWRFDQSLLDTGKRSDKALNIPPGPNSPVGIIWNGLSRPGIGLHGTSDPETIGRARSAGCIRLANWDAIRLPTLIRPGATIEVR